MFFFYPNVSYLLLFLLYHEKYIFQGVFYVTQKELFNFEGISKSLSSLSSIFTILHISLSPLPPHPFSLFIPLLSLLHSFFPSLFIYLPFSLIYPTHLSLSPLSVCFYFSLSSPSLLSMNIYLSCSIIIFKACSDMVQQTLRHFNAHIWCDKPSYLNMH